MKSIEPKFDSLMTEYRSACPEPEASAVFLPGIWGRIDARKTLLRHARGWTSAYVTAAALICMLLAVLITLQAGNATRQTYVDVLDDHQDTSELVEASRPAPEAR